MANKIVKWTGIGLLASLAAIQLYRPEKNIATTTPPSDIVTAYQVPEAVASVLHRACYDCHSNNTKYPWYNNIQPVGIWLADHVNEGKEELNFSEYATFTPKRKLKKLKEIVSEVEEGEMPLESYLWVHGEAKLSAEEKAMLIDWAKGLSQKIQMTEGGDQPK
jgi:exonuclease VII small subunit